MQLSAGPHSVGHAKYRALLGWMLCLVVKAAYFVKAAYIVKAAYSALLSRLDQGLLSRLDATCSLRPTVLLFGMQGGGRADGQVTEARKILRPWAHNIADPYLQARRWER
eukprot:1144026-Pelagomonas_calceolata.AAC.3